MPSDLARQIPPDQRDAFLRLRLDWHARLAPIDEAERGAVDAIVALAWRARRLDAIEEQVMTALLEGRALGALPSPALILRWRARLERDRAAAEAALRQLWALRPEPPEHPSLNPPRLEWLARQIRARAARAAAARLATGQPERLDEPPGVEAPPDAPPPERRSAEPRAAVAG